MNGRVSARVRTGAGNMLGSAFSRRMSDRRFLSARHSDMCRNLRIGPDHATKSVRPSSARGGGPACWRGAKIASWGGSRLIGSAMRKLVAFLALALALTASAGVGAQTYPARPITIVVPFAAGGPTDALV